MISYEIKTFGCKVNTYDSGLLEQRFAKNGFTAHSERPEVFVLNSCAVTAEATSEVLRQARKLKRTRPDSLVVVTGCSAQVDTERLSAAGEIDLIVANSHKGELERLISERLAMQRANVAPNLERIHKSNIFKKADLEPGGGREEGHTRAFVKVQDGCNSFCTFCVIPFARGKSRSIAITELREHVKTLLEEGVREVVLTGVHIGDYEFGLENLVEDLLLHTRVPRLRLTSLEPVELSPRLLELFQDPRLCPHFHMSIQSASTPVLTGMKRKYTADQVEQALQEIQKQIPHAFVGMDVIAGFPGEGENEFLETYQRLLATPWTRLHVFPYSERPGTYAVRLAGKNDRATILRRAERLRALSFERHFAAAKKQIGLTKKILILKNGQGLSRDYWPVNVTATPIETNAEISLSISGTAYDARGRFTGTLTAN